MSGTGRRLALRLAAAAALTWAGAPAAEEDWRLAYADGGVEVYLRVSEAGYREFKGVTRVRASLGACVALMRDTARMPQWVHRLRRAEILRRVSDREAYVHTVSVMDWPLMDRDAVVRSTLTQDPDSLAVTIRGVGEPEALPPDERYVRMPVVESTWRFTPVGPGVIEVSFQGYGDPGGALSSGLLRWIAQNLIWEAPYRTLLGLREAIADPVYQGTRYPFITEPPR